MSATLTAIQPVLFSAAQVISNEPVGAIEALDMRFDNKGVAVGDVVRVPVAPTLAASDFTSSNAFPDGANTTATAVDVQITKSRKVSWDLTGEQIKSLENGAEQSEWIRQLIAQGIRTLRNEMEIDACAALKAGASRATGTAGTTPFASSVADSANVLRILIDNGAPMDGNLSLVINTAAGVNLRSLGNLVQTFQAGTDATLRNGDLLRLHNLRIRESAGIVTHTAGTLTSVTETPARTVGLTSFAIAGTTISLTPGDCFTIAGDTNVYVSQSTLSAGGTLNIGRPGLRVAGTGGQALTIGATYAPNIAFHRNACVGIVRPPEIPGSAIIDRMVINGPNGEPFLLLMLNLYGKIVWELHCAWGFRAVNSEHIAILRG